MNSTRLLFSNKFITKPVNQDVPSTQKQEFRKHIDTKVKQQKTNDIINKVRSNNNYSDLATFKSKHTIPLDSMNNIQLNNQQNIKIEKKSIVSIDTRNRDINKYPLQNDFITTLGKTFFNVKSIKLISSEFPNTDQVIKNIPTELQNNLIVWENEEDIDLNFFTDITINTIKSYHLSFK